MTYVIGLFSSGSLSPQYADTIATTLLQFRLLMRILFSGGTGTGAAFFMAICGQAAAKMMSIAASHCTPFDGSGNVLHSGFKGFPHGGYRRQKAPVKLLQFF